MLISIPVTRCDLLALLASDLENGLVIHLRCLKHKGGASLLIVGEALLDESFPAYLLLWRERVRMSEA
jgi:hypothetical protein